MASLNVDKKTPQRLQLFGPAGWHISYSNLIKMKQIEYFMFFFPSAWLLALQPTLTVSPLCRLSFTLALPAEYTQLKCTKQLRVAQRSTKLWSTCCWMLTAVLETPHESLLSRQPLDGDMSPWHFLDPADFHCCFPVLSLFFFFVLFPTVLSLIIWANNLKNSPAAC